MAPANLSCRGHMRYGDRDFLATGSTDRNDLASALRTASDISLLLSRKQLKTELFAVTDHWLDCALAAEQNSPNNKSKKIIIIIGVIPAKVLNFVNALVSRLAYLNI